MNQGVGSHGEAGETSCNELTSIVVEPMLSVTLASRWRRLLPSTKEVILPRLLLPFVRPRLATGEAQGYACATGRYLNAAAGKVALDDAGRALADDMLDLWFEEHVISLRQNVSPLMTARFRTSSMAFTRRPGKRSTLPGFVESAMTMLARSICSPSQFTSPRGLSKNLTCSILVRVFLLGTLMLLLYLGPLAVC